MIVALFCFNCAKIADCRCAQELAAQGKPVLVNAIYPPTDFRKGSLSM